MAKIGKIMRCHRCGKEVVRAASTQKYCKACAAAIKKESGRAGREGRTPLVYAACAMCGGEFLQKVANQRFCAVCSPIHAKEASRARSKKASTRPKRSVVCVRCGKSFLTRGTQAKYCSYKCSDAARRERDAAAMPAEKPNARVWTLGKIAAANGMSYGYLMAAIEANGGDIPKTMRIPEDCRDIQLKKKA